jgi:hypothetical protein
VTGRRNRYIFFWMEGFADGERRRSGREEEDAFKTLLSKVDSLGARCGWGRTRADVFVDISGGRGQRRQLEGRFERAWSFGQADGTCGA